MSMLDIAQFGLVALVAAVGVGWFIYESRKDNSK